MRIHLLLTTIAATILSSCTADLSYRKLGDTWASEVGYSDFEIGKNKYKVMYTGGVDNSTSTVTKYAYQRAKDLCQEKGFDGYKTVNTDNVSQASHIGIGSMLKSQYTYSLEIECEKK